MTETDKFETALQAFLSGCQKIHREYCEQRGYTAPCTVGQEWRLDRGPKFVRVVHGDSAFCFVEKATGNVLKSAGWKAPAKGVRSNIYDEKGGLGGVGPHGALYLR